MHTVTEQENQRRQPLYPPLPRKLELFWCIECQIFEYSRIKIPFGSKVGLNYLYDQNGRIKIRYIKFFTVLNKQKLSFFFLAQVLAE